MRFFITTTLERTLSEINSYRDREAQIEPLLLILDSRNFHWMEMHMKQEMTRIEAIRANLEPDRNHQWEWPTAFRVIQVKKGRRTEHEVQRGHRGKGIFLLEICGMPFQKFSLPTLMRRRHFCSFAFRVGRLTKVVIPQEGRHLPQRGAIKSKSKGENNGTPSQMDDLD
jgi:hypothetical protein